MTPPIERYFYHSFTRPVAGEDQSVTCLRILECIATRGLILAPEIHTLFEPTVGAQPAREMRLIQKRICFTELAPSELNEHAKTFGSFALEWNIETLRAMGAIPVFYVPITHHVETYEGLAAALLARLTEVQTLLTRLESLSAAAEPEKNSSDNLHITVNGAVVGPTNITVAAARDLTAFLQSGGQSFEMLRNAIQGLSGYFYPVDDLQYTGPLAYYRQREWRIVGNLAHLNRPVIFPTDADTQRSLAEINSTFWLRKLQFITGEFTRAEQSQIFPRFLGRPVVQTARRVIGPSALVEEMRSILQAAGCDTPVVALEAL